MSPESRDLYEELVHLDERVDVLEKKLLRLSAQNEDCQRLLNIPGIGLLRATALVAAIGDISVFKNGREPSAASVRREWEWTWFPQP